ncbi:alpha/beta hydrolase [Streptomyces sp. NPDC006551]|uniref:alpha/beta hydrolase n=1 Tax=Streptomyces sp. NPDC006551 TaxID=3157178 RepID=UPI0033BE0D2B
MTSDRPVGRRTVTVAAALAAAGLALPTPPLATARAAVSGTAAPDLVLRLPAPTGPYAVGVTALHLVDGRRTDPWSAEPAVREVMVSVHYPARTVAGHPRAPQMTPAAARMFPFVDVAHLHRELPASGVDWAATLGHAHTGAPALAGPWPLLLHTPGGGDPRTLGTTLAQDLAGHGHVVVSLDHPGETTAVEFPDGRLRTTELGAGDPAHDSALFRRMIDTRIADLRFVLDRMSVLAAGRRPDAAGRPLPDGLARAIDLRRVGAYGHSAGGTTVAQALHDDRRLHAAVNLEGYLDLPDGEPLPVAREGTRRPLLLLGTDGFRDARFDRSWSAALTNARGWIRRRQLDDSGHWVFTDYAAMAPRLEAAGLMTAEGREAMVGALTPARSVPTVRRRVRAFFARHLPSR